VVELNGEAIPREAYSSTALAEGDRVEIYNLVDGG
jgi:thiamine biosynthesis protein ThiS